jgi:hypothetical protein
MSGGFNAYGLYALYNLIPANATAAPLPWTSTNAVKLYPNGYVAYWEATFSHRPPSTLFYTYCGNALSLFFIGVIVIVYIYADQVSKQSDSPDDEKKDHTHARRSRVTYQKWWSYVKYAVLLTCLTTVIGSLYW